LASQFNGKARPQGGRASRTSTLIRQNPLCSVLLWSISYRRSLRCHPTSYVDITI